MASEDDEEEFWEAPPARAFAALLREAALSRARACILRWRLLSPARRFGLVFGCSFACLSVFLFTVLIVAWTVTAVQLPDPPAAPGPLLPPLGPSQASGIWGVKKAGKANETQEPFKSRPPGPPAPMGPPKPAFIPPPAKNWLHVVMATMNRGVNGSQSTVLRSVQSLFNLQSGPEIREQNITITIFNGNGHLDKHPQLYEVMREFQQDFKTGLVEIVNAPQYEQLADPEKVKRTWNDSLERVLWRSKENLDFCYAMNHSAQFGRYILFLEDDIKATNVWPTKLLTFLHNCPSVNATVQPWLFIVLYFPHGGTDCVPFGWNCCTQAFVMKPWDVKDLCEFIVSKFDENPIDWLLAWYKRKRRRSSLQVIPNLFQHWTTISTLSEKGNATTHESLTFED